MSVCKAMSFLLAVSFLFFSASCSRFNQTYFINEAFGFNLKKVASGKITDEKNGLFVVYDVSENDLIFKKAFNENTIVSKKYVPFEFNGRELGKSKWGRTVYRHWKYFDGYFQASVYYQEERMLFFGYFTDIGG